MADDVVSLYSVASDFGAFVGFPNAFVLLVMIAMDGDYIKEVLILMNENKMLRLVFDSRSHFTCFGFLKLVVTKFHWSCWTK